MVIIEKETFIRKMNAIIDFGKEQDTLNNLINIITDGYPVVTLGNGILSELLESITKVMNIDSDLLSWWLWDDVDKIIYYKDKEIKVETLEELYDYILSFE